MCNSKIRLLIYFFYNVFNNWRQIRPKISEQKQKKFTRGKGQKSVTYHLNDPNDNTFSKVPVNFARWFFYHELVRSSLRLVSTSSSSEKEEGFLFSLSSGAIRLFRRRPRATSAMSESGSELRICWCARWRSRHRPMWISSDLDPNSRWQIEHSRKCGGRDCRALPIIEMAVFQGLLTFLKEKKDR